MCFDAKHEGNRLVFRFKGKLDTNCINKIYSSVLQSIKEADDIVFDMSEAEYISSLFLNLCMITAREKTMNNFSIVNAKDEVAKVFKIAGFNKLFKINN